ncbi:MAG: glycosyltransferase [Planctomycetota bacterium]
MEPYLEFFNKRGHKVYFFASCRPIIYKTGIETFDISYGAHGRKTSTKWRYFMAGLKLRKLLKEIKPDILHGHYVTSTGVISLISGFRPFLVSARGSDLITSVKSSLWRMILRKVFDESVLVHTVSDELSALVKTLGVPEEKIITLSQGVYIGLFDYKPRLTIPATVRLLCTRAFRPVYDQETVLNACSILKKKKINFTLTFAAGSDMQENIENIAGKKGLADQINFLGGYENRSLPSIMAEHDIYISAALWDGTSVSLLEAMSCGLFPIVSKTKSNQAWIEENKTGLMFQCGNAEELADKIIQAVKDSNLRQTAVEKNRKVVAEKANREKNMLLLEKKYYEMVQ